LDFQCLRNAKHFFVFQINLKAMKINLNTLLEWSYVLLFSFFLVYVGLATTMNYQLNHPFPYGLSASDAFGEVAYTEGIKNLGNYRYLPYYIRSGFDDTLGFHMPIYNHIVALFSFASGLQVWDSLLIIGFLYSIFSVLIMYLIIRNFNKNIALISLPLTVFLYVRNFNIVYTWGIWDLVMATSFLLAAIWILNKTNLSSWHVALAILVSGVALTHISEAIFLAIFIALFFAVKIIMKKLSLNEIKKIILAGILTLIFSFYYLVIFKVGYALGGTATSIKYEAPKWFDVILTQFGWVLPIIIIGVLLSIFLILTKKGNIALFIGIFMLFIGFTNFISSFASRAFQTRYLWPIYLSIFIGIVPYFLLKIFIKNWKIIYSISISLVLTISITYAFYEKTANPGIMNQFHWEHISWIRESTPEDARLMYFYGDPYDQEAVIWNNKRVSYRVKMDDFVNAINERKIKRQYYAQVAAADDADLLYRKSAFSFGYHAKETDTSIYIGPQDICQFDYFIFDKIGRQQALVDYNLLIANELIRSGIVEVIFDNQVTVILKNNNLGGNCIEERDF